MLTYKGCLEFRWFANAKERWQYESAGGCEKITKLTRRSQSVSQLLCLGGTGL